MMSIKNILTISRFESKVLWRNWFFRIISIAGVGFITIFSIAVFSEVSTPRWLQLSNSWIMPYSTMVMIGIPQVAAVIFLATGLIKKDKKVDTNEVFFVRPISNLDFVLGKALALFKLFFLLNMALLCIPLVVNLTSPYLEFNPLAFLMYPLITSVPSIVFTTGISFLLVTLIRNQPVTIVLLLGVAGVQIIYYFDQFSNILDFSAFRLSLLVSEIGGFIDYDLALQQRFFYFITGTAMLFLTALALDRLPGTRWSRITTGSIALGLLTISTVIMVNLWEHRQGPMLLREEMVEINGKWADEPNVMITANYLDVEIMDGELKSTARLQVINPTREDFSKVYITLNPGLDVVEILIDGEKAAFEREVHIVAINCKSSLAPGQKATIEITYQGTINQAAAHLEVAQERYEEPYEYFMYSLQKKYAYLQPDFTLLTKDTYWYPDAKVGYSRKSTSKESKSFIDFQLNVRTSEGLLPISQGKRTLAGDEYQFRPEYPLPQISLVVGKYEQKEIIVDSISYSLYHHPEHNYFMEHLGELSDTLSFLISDIVTEYEDGQKLKYPFNRLQFVEIPLQFSAYSKIYEGHQAFVQPEIVFWPEEGGGIRQFDFRRQLRDMDRQAREENQELSDKQKQANVFNDLIKKVYTKQIGSGWFFDGRDQDDPDYSLFPNLYAYNSGIVSENWELLNQSISSYLRNDKQAEVDFSRNVNGISFAEECNNLMRESTLSEILTEETNFSKIQKSVSLKGQYLFSYLGQLIGEDELKLFLYQWINSHQHQISTYEEFRTAFQDRFEVNLDPLINKVYTATAQAAFEFEDLQKYEVMDGDRKRYQVLLSVTNTGENDGVLEIKFDSEEDSDESVFRNRSVNQEVKEEMSGYLSVIKQGETRQLGFIVDEKPDKITLNTMISRNIPSVITLPLGAPGLKKSTTFFEGERIIDKSSESEGHEVIVDNEDEGFSTFSPIEPTYLRAYLNSRNPNDQKYFGNWYRSYSKWLATTGSDFYGRVIRSAHFTRSGNGEKLTTWSPDLKEDGFYDVYVYMMGKNQNQYVGNSQEGRQFNYNYTINHADGEDQIKFNISNAETGWNYLGSYYFNKIGSSVSLSDECELRTVYADAIKWVKQ